MKASLVAISILFVLINIQNAIGDCIWYGQCHQRSGHKLNCPYDGPGFPATTAKSFEILNRRCPHLKANATTHLCCDDAQIETLDLNLQIADGVFGQCQTCLNNIVQVICDFTCAPNQSKFMKRYEELNTDILGQDIYYVNKVDVRMDYEYMERTFESCRHTIYPVNGRPALDLTCGAWGAEQCTPQRWFDFMGTINNPIVPFQMNYIPVDDPAIRFTAETLLCHESDANTYPCDCTDCPVSCPISSGFGPDM